MRHLLHCVILAIALAPLAVASTTPELGLRDHTPTLTAITGARIVVSPEESLDSATLVIEDGVIRACGRNVKMPDGARIIDLEGRTIYPGFIDPCSDYGLPTERSEPGGRYRGPRYYADRIGGSAWNEAIHSEINWADSFKPDSARAESYWSAGFTAVQTARLDGVFRGRSAVVLLGSGLPNDQLLRARSHHFASFVKGKSSQDYPSSLMGAIALIRQMYLDLDWHRQALAAWKVNPAQEKPEYNSAIDALGDPPADTLFFFTNSEHDIIRAARLGHDIDRSLVIVGSGTEYRRIEEIAALNAPLVIPLMYPEVPEVKSIENELDVSLGELRRWERAPGNAAVLEQHGVSFAFTMLADKKNKFLGNLREAVRRGLSRKAALRALTTTPAALCGVERHLGSLEPGKLASFSVWSGDLFDETSKALAVWIAGERHDLAELQKFDFAGVYRLIAADSISLTLSGSTDDISGSFIRGADTTTLKGFEIDRNHVSFLADSLFGVAGVHRYSARLSGDSLIGKFAAPDGIWFDWLAVRASRASDSLDGEPAPMPAPTEYVSRRTFPDRAWGFEKSPPRQDVLVQNATIWTCDSAGVLEGADILVRDGKIAAVGRNLTPPRGVTVIDAAGRHVTPGIIDEHSHTAIAGDVNEGTHAITSEVRIEDVLDPDDVNIYRQLAGGVTAARLLHGSANPIGGQAAAVKWRWGMPADSLLLKGAPRAIKFALGENVKQSGWGEAFSIRYPQTRLGVDAIIRDAFLAARQYEADWAAFRALSSSAQNRTIPPRRDLQLEAIVDILHRRLLVHCHAYVAPEMLMFLRLAEEFGVTVQSFGHGLEGYKVAPELAKAGVGVGSAPDWWAYKFETYDGIAQSPALMAEKGVVVAINSDSPDLARRLSQEAAKSVMYGGMDPQEALKMVTINPARLMGIDDQVGSLRAGKDADFVIWDGNPLSLYAHVVQTWIDGRRYFDLAADSLLREQLADEKRLLVQKVLQSKDNKDKRHGPSAKTDRQRPELSASSEIGGRHETR